MIDFNAIAQNSVSTYAHNPYAVDIAFSQELEKIAGVFGEMTRQVAEGAGHAYAGAKRFAHRWGMAYPRLMRMKADKSITRKLRPDWWYNDADNAVLARRAPSRNPNRAIPGKADEPLYVPSAYYRGQTPKPPSSRPVQGGSRTQYGARKESGRETVTYPSALARTGHRLENRRAAAASAQAEAERAEKARLSGIVDRVVANTRQAERDRLARAETERGLQELRRKAIGQQAIEQHTAAEAAAAAEAEARVSLGARAATERLARVRKMAPPPPSNGGGGGKKGGGKQGGGGQQQAEAE